VEHEQVVLAVQPLQFERRSALAMVVGICVGPMELSWRDPPAWLVAMFTVASLLALVGVSADAIQHEFDKWGTWGAWHVPR